MKPAIFLDRDGTIIVDKVYLNDPEQIEFFPGAFSALKKLQDSGHLLFVVTNQSGVARGLVSLENLAKIHERMDALLQPQHIQITQYYYSPHAADSNHPTRKPNPGMLEQAIKDHNLDRSKCWMIGDRMGDVGAGFNAKVKTILLSSSGEKITSPQPDFIAADLSEAADIILQP